MTRLSVLVEGQTEERFVHDLLAPHLAPLQVWATPIVVHTSRSADGRKRRGGGHWRLWKRDLEGLCRDRSPDARVTTLFDLYGLPADFPGLDACTRIADTVARCAALEARMAAEIVDDRFIPYLQRHEIEALVLVDPTPLRELDAEADVAGLLANLGGLSPEDVNDGEATAPSKRLARFVPRYTKTVHGPLVMEATGLARIRDACPRFGAWLTRLEALAP